MRPKYASTTKEGKILTTYRVWTREDFRPARRRFFYCAVAALSQQKSSTMMLVQKQWTDEHQTTRKLQWTTEEHVIARILTLVPHGSEWPYSFLQAVGNTLVNYCKCTNVASSNSSTSAVRIVWLAGWHQVVFSNESCFNLWVCHGRVHIIRYAGQYFLPDCIMERHSGRINGVKVWSVISYYGRFLYDDSFMVLIFLLWVED